MLRYVWNEDGSEYSLEEADDDEVIDRVLDEYDQALADLGAEDGDDGEELT